MKSYIVKSSAAEAKKFKAIFGVVTAISCIPGIPLTVMVLIGDLAHKAVDTIDDFRRYATCKMCIALGVEGIEEDHRKPWWEDELGE